MKVILNQDIKKLGKKGDVVEVAKGYARNYLLPKNLGIKATPKNILLAEKMQEKKKNLKFKIKMFKINHQIIFGTSIILGSDRNSLRYLLTLNTSGESGVPK